MPASSRVTAAYTVVCLVVAFLVWFEIIPGLPRELALLFLGGAAVLALGTIIGITLQTRRGRAELARAASARGFDYSAELRGLGLPGLLFRAGENVTATHVVDATRSPTPFVTGSLTGQYGSDTSAARMLAASFVAIPLERTVPNIVLFGEGIGALKRAGIALGSRQRLSLEGDFNSTFTLYCPEGYERDALEIFTPNLMGLLVDTAASVDIEFVDDWMFVYGRSGLVRDEATLERVIAVTESVRSTVRRQTARYRDERSAALAAPAFSGAEGAASTVRTVSPSEHAARAGRISERGHRVKTTSTPFQRIITVLSTLLLLGALAGYLWTQFAPG